MAPVITVIGLQFGVLLGCAILTETVFAWPGLGRLLVDSIFARDYPTVQGLVIVFALLFALVNLAIDLFYSVIDPGCAMARRPTAPPGRALFHHRVRRG